MDRCRWDRPLRRCGCGSVFVSHTRARKVQKLDLHEFNKDAGLLRAERRAAELLKEMKRTGQRSNGYGNQKSESRHATPIPTLDHLGVTKDQSSQWQQLAEIP
jgi:hypothetical protein